MLFRTAACFMALALIVISQSGWAGTAEAATQAELREQIAALQQAAGEAKDGRAALQQELNAIKGKADRALEEKQLRDQELAYIDQQIASTEQQIAYYDELIAQEEAELAEAQAREERQYELFCKRVRAIEEQGPVSYWSVLFSVEDFSDMLDLFTVISDTIDYDNAVIDQLRADQAAVADILAGLNTAREEQAAKKAELDEQRAEQERKVAEAIAVVENLRKDQAAAEKAAAAEAEAAAAIDREIREKQAELEELMRQQQISAGNGYVWPVRGCYIMTSRYGSRIDPFTGRPSFHYGLDISAPKNTPIHAVKGGTVMTSARHYSYGEYVVIVHPDGTSSLYAHMSTRAVRVGDTVTQDQVIGYVGLTGDTNGYHLHLEIRLNGSRVDPYEDVFKNSGLPLVKWSTY